MVTATSYSQYIEGVVLLIDFAVSDSHPHSKRRVVSLSLQTLISNLTSF